MGQGKLKHGPDNAKMLLHPVPVLIIYDDAKAVPCLMISLVPSDKQEMPF